MRYNEIATYTGLAVSYIFSQLVVNKLQNSPYSIPYFLGTMCLLTPITSFLNSIYEYNADKRDNQGNEFHKTIIPPIGTFLYSIIYGSSKQTFGLFLAAATTFIVAAPLSAARPESPLFLTMPIFFNLLVLKDCKLLRALLRDSNEEAPQR